MDSPCSKHLVCKAATMNYQISIPKPCHEDWDAMTPGDRGRHCGQCSKMVMDFTDWTIEEISAYLYAQRHQSVCGRFRDDQLQNDYFSPETYIYQLQHSGLSFIKRIAALILFVFCLSSVTANAQHHSKGDVVQVQPNKQPQQHLTGEPAIVAPTPKQQPLMGKVVPQKPRPVKPKDPKCTTANPDVVHTMGIVALPPKPDTTKYLKGRVAPKKQ